MLAAREPTRAMGRQLVSSTAERRPIHPSDGVASRKDRRAGKPPRLPTECASAISATSRATLVRSAHQSLNVDRKPCGTQSAFMLTTTFHPLRGHRPRDSKSISGQIAERTSPDRAAVRMTNSSARDDDSSCLRKALMKVLASETGSAAWCLGFATLFPCR